MSFGRRAQAGIIWNVLTRPTVVGLQDSADVMNHRVEQRMMPRRDGECLVLDPHRTGRSARIIDRRREFFQISSEC